MRDSLIYPISDAFDITLNEMPGGSIRGAAIRTLKAGVIPFVSDLVVGSVEARGKKAVYLARVYKALWLLALVQELDKGATSVTLVSFDGNAANILPKDISRLEGKLNDVVTMVQGVKHTCYSFDVETTSWKQDDTFDLVEFVKEKNA